MADMDLSNYDGLKAAIADFLNRTTLTSAVPAFVMMAEARLNRRLRVNRMVARESVSIDDEYMPLPADWASTENLEYPGSPEFNLRFVDRSKISRLKASHSAAGQPTYFTIEGSSFRVTPSPDTAYDFDHVYFTRIPRLSASNPSNWLLETSPDIYLYGSLIHSAPYLKDDARIMVWQTLYDTAVDELIAADERESNGRGPLAARAQVLG